MNAADIITAISACRPGDVLTITFDGGSRAVTVDSVTGGYVFTTSGRVRSGPRGGALRLDGPQGYPTFQPTLAQPPRRILNVARHALLCAAA